jgi:uncharacterized protein HemX
MVTVLRLRNVHIRSEVNAWEEKYHQMEIQLKNENKSILVEMESMKNKLKSSEKKIIDLEVDAESNEITIKNLQNEVKKLRIRLHRNL